MPMTPEAAQRLLVANRGLITLVCLKYLAASYMFDQEFQGNLRPVLKQAVVTHHNTFGGMTDDDAQARLNHAANAIRIAYTQHLQIVSTSSFELEIGAEACAFLRSLDDILAKSNFFETHLPSLASYVLTDELVDAAKELVDIGNSR